MLAVARSACDGSQTRAQLTLQPLPLADAVTMRVLRSIGLRVLAESPCEQAAASLPLILSDALPFRSDCVVIGSNALMMMWARGTVLFCSREVPGFISDCRRTRAKGLLSGVPWRLAGSRLTTCYLVDPASSHMLVSKIKPCMCKYELIQTVKLRMAH